jgi:SAM-dependent methyltransferase
MEGSLSPGSDYKEWKAKRKFIAELVNHDGSILDIGCANGFFLRSLQEWSRRQLTPYGIDIEGTLLARALDLFPQYRNNFQELNVTLIENISELGLPDQYDFIFWNFLGGWRIEDDQWQTVLRKILHMAKRRLILGFYGTNRHRFRSKEWTEERSRLLQVPESLKNAGFILSGFKLNPTNYNQIAVWFDKPSE